MDEYVKSRLIDHLKRNPKGDSTHLQSDYQNFVKNFRLDFDFFFDEYLKYRKFNEKTLFEYLEYIESEEYVATKKVEQRFLKTNE